MMRRIVFLALAVLCTGLPGRLLAGGKFACLLGPTGKVICAKVVVEGRLFYVPVNALKSLYVQYTASESILTIEGNKAQPIKVLDKFNARVVRLDELAKALDADYSFDKATATVSLLARLKSVDVDGSAVRVRFSLGVGTPSVYTLTKPSRIVLDVRGARLGTPARQVDLKRDNLQGVRLGQPDQSIARIVMDMAKDTACRIVDSGSPSEIRIELDDQPLNAGNKPVVVGSKSLKGLLVVIDPGHGGNDPGALTEEVLEKDLDLAIAKALKAQMTRAGAKVILTREDDTYVRLKDRSAVANQNAAGIFISLHCNAAKASGATGIETYYSAFSGSSKLGAAVQAALIRATGANNRRLWPDPGLMVLKGVNSPSLLIECGFIDSKTECKKLCDSAYQGKLAQAVVEGVAAYRKDATAR